MNSLAVRVVRAVRRWVFQLKAPGRVSFGSDFIVGSRAEVTRGRSLCAGDRVSIGSRLTSHVHLEIASDVMISTGVSFISNDHPFDETEATIHDFAPNPVQTIVLEGDNLIGYGATLIGPLVVGRGAIIGARAVVTSNVPPNVVCAGVPARVIRSRRADAS